MKEMNVPSDPALIEALRTEAMRIEEDSIFSAKRHFNACDTWTMGHYALGVPAALLAILVTTAVVRNHPEFVQLLGLGSAIFAALLTFLKPNDRASQHRAIGNQYLALRNDARVFREIDMIENVNDAKKSERLRRMAQRRTDLNASAPTTPAWAFEKAREGNEEGQTTYAADKKD